MYVYVRPFLYGTWYDTTTWYGKPIISVPFLELQQCPQYIHCCAAGSGLLLAGPMASSQLHERMHACWRDIFHTEGKSKRQASSSLTSPSWYVRPEVRGTRITLAEKVIPVWYWTRISTRGELCSHPECYYVHKQYKSKAQASLQKAEARFLPWCHLTQRATTNDELRSQVASYKMRCASFIAQPNLTRSDQEYDDNPRFNLWCEYQTWIIFHTENGAKMIAPSPFSAALYRNIFLLYFQVFCPQIGSAALKRGSII